MVITARSELWKVLFLAPSVCGFLFLYEIYREPLNRFVPNTHGKRVWRLACKSLKSKVKVTRDKKRHFFGPLQMQDPKKSPKIAIWAPSHNFVGLYVRN